MSAEIITEDLTVAEALGRAPGALGLFQKYGVNPITDCGPNRYILRLEEIPARCQVDELEKLIADLNATATAER